MICSINFSVKYRRDYRKKLIVFLLVCLINSVNFLLFADSKSIVLGGAGKWPELSVAEGISKGKGRFGRECIELEKNARKVTMGTDLLLDFEGNKVKDISGKYEVISNSLYYTQKAVMGRGAALSRGNGSGIKLKGTSGTIFGTEGNPGSFVIEFWLCPSIAENGETIFSWHSSRIILDYVMYQAISAQIFNNRLEWTFTNVFEGYNDSNGELSLLSYSAIIPEKWAHHSISYDEETGLLEYRIDGHLEALKHVTQNGREGDTIFQPMLGHPECVEICPRFTGFIDDFRIVRLIYPESDSDINLNEDSYDFYKVTGGHFVSQPLMTKIGSVLKNLEIVDTVPPQTEIRYYVRGSDNYFNWTENYPEWIQVKNKEEIKNVSGLYFQVAADLFPDGGGNVSPSVTEIKLNYEEQPLPLPPLNVRAKAGNGSVDLKWDYSVDENTGGYFIYYGSRPGEYLGSDAAEGPSPIKIDNLSSFRLTGLKNGKIYYFAVSTYSKLDPKINGSLSGEVYARPGNK